MKVDESRLVKISIPFSFNKQSINAKVFYHIDEDVIYRRKPKQPVSGNFKLEWFIEEKENMSKFIRNHDNFKAAIRKNKLNRYRSE